MKIPYKVTSGAALVALALPLVPSAPRAVDSWVMCGLIEDQWDTTRKLVTLVLLGAYVVFVRQGLRNRSGPRWLAIAGLLALWLWVESQSLQISAGCYGTGGMARLLLEAGIVSLMFLHHGFQSRAKLVAGPSSGSSSGPDPASSLRRAYRGVLPALAFMPVASYSLRMLERFGRGSILTERVIVPIRDCMSWAMFALFLIAAALLLALLIVRLRNPIRT
jgi:hypothetical protein